MSIKLLIIDVDGTLTDGKINIGLNGELYKSFNVKDGSAIKRFIEKGIEVAIVTGRNSEIVKYRARELGVKHLYQNVQNKVDILHTLTKELKLDNSQVAAIGDDYNDYELLKNVKYPFVVNDGVNKIKDIAYYVTQKKGGEGVISELYEVCKSSKLI